MTEFSLDRLCVVLNIGQLSISMHLAQDAVTLKRYAYHARLKKYERKHGNIGRLDPNNAAHAGAIAYTADAYEALMAARRNAYNIKRRWQNACRKFN